MTAGKVVAALGIAGAATAAWGVGIERHLYTVRHATAAILEPGADPIRILHISDVHLAPWQARKQAWVASLASLRPDLVVNTGDNVGHPDALPALRATYAGFQGVPGVFVHGSNDMWAPRPRNPLRYIIGPSHNAPKTERLDLAGMEAFFTERLGWHSVDNAHTRLAIRGLNLGLFGTGDGHHGLDRLDLLPEAASDLADASLRLAVTHAPYRRILDGFIDAGADMIFAGHTHGGQVRIPGFGALVANCDLPLAQTRGLSSWSHGGRTVPLNVSAGIGHSIYAPVRFACRPEASLLTLVARSAG